MAHPQPHMDPKHTEDIVLSDNDSDASYDMADDESSQAAKENKNGVPRSAFKGPVIDPMGQDKGKGEAIDREFVLNDSGSVIFPEDLHAKAGQADLKEEKEEEHFYDMCSDQQVGKIRQNFRLTGLSMLGLLDSLVGLDPAERGKISALLQERARSIAYMFGDDIPKLKQSLQTALDGMTEVCKESNDVWNEIRKVRLELETETHTRRRAENLQKESLQSSIKLNRQYHEQARLRQTLQDQNKELLQAVSALKGELLKETNMKDVNFQQVLLSQQAHSDLKQEVARNLAFIAAQRVQIQSMRNELEAARSCTSVVEKEMSVQNSAQRELVKTWKRERSGLIVQNKQLDNARQSLIEEQEATRAYLCEVIKERDAMKVRYGNAIEELNAMKASYHDAIEAIKAERKAKEAAIPKKLKLETENVQLKLLLQEVQTQSAMSITSERELREKTQEENEKLSKECASSERMIKDMHYRHALLLEAGRHQSAVDGERFPQTSQAADGGKYGTDEGIKGCQHTSTNTSCEHMAEETDREREIEKLRKELSMSETKAKYLHKLVENVVASDNKRVQYIVKINTELTKANNELAELDKFITMLRCSKIGGEQETINKLLDEKQESRRNLNFLGEELIKGHDFWSGLAKEKMNLEKDVAEAKRKYQKLRGIITTLIQQLRPTELEGLTKRFRAAPERNSIGLVSQCEALDDIALIITTFCNSIVKIDSEYSEGPEPLFSKESPSINNQASDKSTIAGAGTQELLDLKGKLASVTTELQKLAQVNLQLLASRDAASRELVERRGQIAELEAMQSRLRFNEGRAIAQFNQMRTSYRCLEDLHHSDLERIKKLEKDLREFLPPALNRLNLT